MVTVLVISASSVIGAVRRTAPIKNSFCAVRRTAPVNCDRVQFGELHT